MILTITYSHFLISFNPPCFFLPSLSSSFSYHIQITMGTATGANAVTTADNNPVNIT